MTLFSVVLVCHNQSVCGVEVLITTSPVHYYYYYYYYYSEALGIIDKGLTTKLKN